MRRDIKILPVLLLCLAACGGQGYVEEVGDDPDESTFATDRATLSGSVTAGASLEVMFPSPLRAEPKRNAIVLATLAAETLVTAVSTSSQGGYYQVRSGTMLGWMKGYSLTMAIPDAPAPGTGIAATLTIAGGTTLPLDGTYTDVTVAVTGGTPASVALSRDGRAAFYTWTAPTSSANGVLSYTMQWCISSPCWDGVAGAHILTATLTLADGTTKTVSQQVTVTTGGTAPAPSPTPSPTPAPTPAPTGTVYYVSTTGNDANNGLTLGSAWRTLSKAAATMQAGATTLVQDGTYTEGILYFRNSGTRTNPITIRSQNYRGARILTTSHREGQSAFYITGSWVYVMNFRMAASTSVPRISGYRSTNDFVHCWAGSHTPSISEPWSGSQGCKVSGNLVEYSKLKDSAVKSVQDYSIVENNEFSNEIEMFNNRDSIVRNNIVWSGSPFGTHIVMKGGTRDNLIYNNVIHMNESGNWGSGIYVGGATGQHAWFFDPNGVYENYNSAVFNNVIIAHPGTTLVNAIMWRSDKGSKVFNNVIKGHFDIGVFDFRRGGIPGDACPLPLNPYFANNVVQGTGSTPWVGQNMWSGTRTWTNNHITGLSSSSAIPQTNPVSGAVNFVNASSDWHLASTSAAINAGTTVVVPKYHGGYHVVDFDVDGNPRVAPWDVGIDEK